MAQCYYGGHVMVLWFCVWRGGLVLHPKNNPIQGATNCRISTYVMVMGGIALVLEDYGQYRSTILGALRVNGCRTIRTYI